MRFLSKMSRHPQANSLTAMAVVAMLCVGAGAIAVQKSLTEVPGIASLQETGKAFQHVTKTVSPAVVFVKVEKTAPAMTMNGKMMPGFQDEWLKKFFGDRMPNFPRPPEGRHSQGTGSGFIISEDGYILTNNHVVNDASKVTVSLADGREFEAKTIGTDSSTDVAVIKIEATGLPVLPMGNSDEAEVGEWVLALGSPFGLSGTVTSGIVSAKGRSSVGITDYENFIQTDAAINPGNSGGPLVNLHGEAIGINTAIMSKTGAFNGIGFAIPINMARDVCEQLIKDGSVTRGYLGIVIQKLTPELAKSFSMDSTDGVLVGDVQSDSPAEKAGMKTGDILVKFDGRKVKNPGALRNMVASTDPEKEVKLTVVRGGEELQMSVAIGKLAAKEGDKQVDAESSSTLGLRVRPLDDQLRKQFGLKADAGLVITQVESGSQAQLAGLAPGMLIKEINRQEVKTMDDFKKLLKEAKDQESLLLLVSRGEFTRYVVVKLKA